MSARVTLPPYKQGLNFATSTTASFAFENEPYLRFLGCEKSKLDYSNVPEKLAAQWHTFVIATIIFRLVYYWGIVPFRVFKNTFVDRVPGPMTLPFFGNMRCTKNSFISNLTSTTRNTEMCLVRSCSAVDPP